MFDVGEPELLRRFIVSTPLPPPPPSPAAIPFPLSYTSIETTNHFLDTMLGNKNHKIILHHHHHENHNHHDDNKDGGTSGWMSPMSPTDHDDGGDYDDVGCRPHHPWSSDEVHALLKLRSTMENWFTWEHVSRKLTEVGFKRTPQECKEKFEEERRYSNIDDTSDDHIIHYNARMFSELEEFYRHGHDNHDDDHHEHVSSEAQEHNQNKRQKLLGEPRTQEKDKVGQEQDPNKEEEEEGEEDDDDNDDKMGKSGNIENEGKPSSPISSSAMVMMMEKKRKRKRKGFEVLKGICEGMVRSMIAQQEEMHKKILEDMTKREEEKIAREETWKKRETERINKELEIRAHEQALASDRNSTIIKFITKFTSVSDDDDDHHHHRHVYEVQSPKTSQSSSCLVPPQTPSSNIPSLSSSQTLTPHNHLYLKHTDDKSLDPNSVQTLRRKTNNPITPKSDKNSDLGKRWPRDEVLALVNIRCRISTKINVNHHHHHREDHHHKDGPSTSKAPSLWERVSEKMLELGYDRSAKRCKEKWENINKYFKKTKNVNKKRPLDSRTCPYFHQLNELYNQGSLAGTNTAAGKVDSGCQYPETRPE